MAYYTGGLAVVGVDTFAGGTRLRASTTQTAHTIQCYLGGALVASAKPLRGMVTFALPELGQYDVLHLLAVDDADAETDYWSTAFAGYSNRIRVRLAQSLATYLPGDTVTIYVGPWGEGEATVLAHEQPLYPHGKTTGFGYYFGYSGFGFDGYYAPGFGSNFGMADFGFDAPLLDWTSEPMAPGTYPVKVVIVDAAGNASTAYETSVTLTTYPAPARDLTIESYTHVGDELVLSWTASSDLP